MTERLEIPLTVETIEAFGEFKTSIFKTAVRSLRGGTPEEAKKAAKP